MVRGARGLALQAALGQCRLTARARNEGIASRVEGIGDAFEELRPRLSGQLGVRLERLGGEACSPRHLAAGGGVEGGFDRPARAWVNGAEGAGGAVGIAHQVVADGRADDGPAGDRFVVSGSVHVRLLSGEMRGPSSFQRLGTSVATRPSGSAPVIGGA